MKACEFCKETFPDHLIQKMTVLREEEIVYLEICAICTLKATNAAHGINRTRFGDRKAQKLLERTQKYLRQKSEIYTELITENEFTNEELKEILLTKDEKLKAGFERLEKDRAIRKVRKW